MRPSPEAMLKVAQTEEQGGERGKMKIFLGYAAEIGKTYTMLEAARQQQDNRERVWHDLRVNISNLRHKLEKDESRPRYIMTESGMGYRFKSEL